MAKASLELLIQAASSDHQEESVPVEVEYKYWGYGPDGERVLEILNAWWVGEGGRELTEDEVNYFNGEIEDRLLEVEPPIYDAAQRMES
jgi:hypothetical protein